jgi:hypothetical protein
MSSAKLALACALAAVSLCACGIATKPLAGTLNLNSKPGTNARRDDPRTIHLPCLRQYHLRFREYTASRDVNGIPIDLPSIQIGKPPIGPTVVFYPTPGLAQGVQIAGDAQNAEVIGAALIYVSPEAPDKLLTEVENCVGIQVTG